MFSIIISVIAFTLGVFVIYVQGRKVDQNVYKNEER